MKLCIVKPDGTSAEVEMSERQPSLESINNEVLFFENYLYKIMIRDNENCDNLELFVGDYSVQTHYNVASDCYESDSELIFSGCFDLAYISIYVDDGNEKSLYTDFLRIATTKQTTRQVEQMLGEIEENLPNFLEVCFSRNKKKSGLIKNEIRSVWNTLQIVDEIIDVYEENYSNFSNHKKADVEPITAIVDSRSMRMIDQESLRWIACNPEQLVQTDKNVGLIVNQKNYLPLKVKTYLSQYSYDIYENRVVLGFLKIVMEYLENQIIGFSKEITELENIPDSIVIQLPNTHELTGRCIYVYYQGVIGKYIKRKNILQEIFYKYEKMLNCRTEHIYGIPKLTNTFKQIYHYRICYECIVKWFELGDYSFNHLNYLFKLKTLSRIFEYYCLIKIQKALMQCGYVFQEAKRIVYDIEDDVEDINNEYTFFGNNFELTLLYEPSIWVNKYNDNINLYSTGYNFAKSRWNDKWTPDFLMKIIFEQKEYYYILDAKYSNIANVKKRYMPDLVLKYSAQIASKDKFFSDVIGVGAIYPGNVDKNYLFKKNSVSSSKQSLPSYFALTIVGWNEGDTILANRIQELLEIVENIEHEISEDEVLDEKPVRLDLNGMLSHLEQNDSTKHLLQNTLNDEVNSLEYENDYDEKVTTHVNGKKCYYYGKTLCLRQKKRCTIVNMPCEYFVSRNEKQLKKGEDSCRNFIRYTKKGKTTRVECSVSGLPGCIGVEECKFCLKKNKTK